MNRKGNTIMPAAPQKSGRPFLQPLAVALVSLILISLALVTGLLDIRSLDKTLRGYMEKRGLAIIRNIQQAATYNFHLLGYALDNNTQGVSGSGLSEEMFSLRETLVLSLLELAQKIDFDRERGLLRDADLASLATGQGIWLVALLDVRGKIIYENRPVPESVLQSAAKVIRGEDGISVDLFDPPGHGPGNRSFAIRRKQGKGTILFALNQDGFLFWTARVSIERAVGEVGLGTDTKYFVATDQAGRILFQRWEAGPPGPLTRTTAGRENQGVIDITTSLQLDGKAVFTGRLGLSRKTADQIVKQEKQRGLVLTGCMVFIAILSMWFLYRNQTRHVANIREMERRLSRAERLSAMGRLAAGVAHEIRNPLNAISMACQRLQKDNLDRLAGIIRDEVRRLNDIVEEFIGFSKSSDRVLKAHDITALVSQMALLVEEEASSRGISLKTDCPEYPLLIWMDPGKIRQALLNIIRNAMESIEEDQGTILLGLAQEGKQWVAIRISDTGAGLSPQEMAHIFDLDYTTKQKGLGLGLTLAHEIVQAHGGEIQVQSEPGKGTILLPVKAQGVQEQRAGSKGSVQS